MPRKKKEPIPAPEFIIDDNGIERKVGEIYTEKFTYQGEPDIFMLMPRDDGGLVRCTCKRDVKEMLRDFFTDLSKPMRPSNQGE